MEELNYEYSSDEENVPPPVEGVVILSEDEGDNDPDVLDLDTSDTLEQQPVSTLTLSVFLKSNFMNPCVFSFCGKESGFIDV